MDNRDEWNGRVWEIRTANDIYIYIYKCVCVCVCVLLLLLLSLLVVWVVSIALDMNAKPHSVKLQRADICPASV